MFLDASKAVDHEVKILVESLLHLSLLLHLANILFNFRILILRIYIVFLLKIDCQLCLLDFIFSLLDLVLKSFDLLSSVVGFYIFVFHRLLRTLAFLSQSFQAILEGVFCCAKKILDLSDVFLDQKFSYTEVTYFTAGALSTFVWLAVGVDFCFL